MSRIDHLDKINRYALRYFISSLAKTNKAKKYLYNRISKDTVKRFYLGYAPKIGLVEYLNRCNLEDREIIHLGLVVQNYDDTVSEFFSDRIIFPVIHAGKILGFGGRTLVDSDILPKYLNSKSSVMYEKKKLLYGLWRARKHIDRVGFALLVEGYFDVLGLYEAKIKNACACCGTAFTKDHALLLKRYTDKVCVLFDGDSAGRDKAKTVMRILKTANIFGGIFKLPNGYDPDEYVKKYGKNGLKELRILH